MYIYIALIKYGLPMVDHDLLACSHRGTIASVSRHDIMTSRRKVAMLIIYAYVRMLLMYRSPGSRPWGPITRVV